MKTFKIYQHPIRGYEAIKVGWSWPAFFLPFVWLCVKKLWEFAGYWLFLGVGVVIFERAIPEEPETGLGIILSLIGLLFAMWLIPPWKGNNWLMKNLMKQGYMFIKEIEAENPDAAKAHVKSASPLIKAEIHQDKKPSGILICSDCVYTINFDDFKNDQLFCPECGSRLNLEPQ